MLPLAFGEAHYSASKAMDSSASTTGRMAL